MILYDAKPKNMTDEEFWQALRELAKRHNCEDFFAKFEEEYRNGEANHR